MPQRFFPSFAAARIEVADEEDGDPKTPIAITKATQAGTRLPRIKKKKTRNRLANLPRNLKGKRAPLHPKQRETTSRIPLEPGRESVLYRAYLWLFYSMTYGDPPQYESLMNDEIYPLYRLLKEDTRYPLEAYQFVRDALSFAQDDLDMGTDNAANAASQHSAEASQRPERHLTGQELCEAIRLYALSQYGYLSKTVLNQWGLNATGDFGNVVYNLISIGWMRKSEDDLREHFDEVYDFETVFLKNFDFAADE